MVTTQGVVIVIVVVHFETGDDTPTGILPERLGRLKVVLPSPIPKDVPRMANNPEYVVRDTVTQLHNKYHVGAVIVLHIFISHVIPCGDHSGLVPFVVNA